MAIKLWHDDVRPPPQGWLWCRTNAHAQEVLAGGDVVECSLDHDLGLDQIEMPESYAELQRSSPEQAHAIFLAGRSEQTGLDLVEWMLERGLVPPVVTIHSWNPDGARRMAWALAQAGHPSQIAPFTP